MAEVILQHWIFTNFIFPFLLIFFIIYGVLEKSKLFGENKERLNALIAAVVGLIFVAAIFPKLVVSNLILFLTVAITTVFVGLLIWGFIAGEGGLKFDSAPKPLKMFIGGVIAVAVVAALLWALGTSGSVFSDLFNFIFKSGWSKDFWTNASFIIVVIIALVAILQSSGKP